MEVGTWNVGHEIQEGSLRTRNIGTCNSEASL